MGRARDPNRDKAFEIFKKASGNIDLVEIASQLNLSPGTIRGWKSKDDWDTKLNGTLRKNMERSKRKKGAQPRNKNAVGHGGTGPPGNKNAVTTGEFETLFLIAWILMSVGWRQQSHKTKSSFSSRRYSS